jgi:hypothetical protein
MPLAEKGVRGKGRQPLSPPQHTEPGNKRRRSAITVPFMAELRHAVSFFQARRLYTKTHGFPQSAAPLSGRSPSPDRTESG